VKAIAQDRYGSADVLAFQEVDRPVAGDGQVLVRVRAAAVNALDWHFMRGAPYMVRPILGWRGPKVKVRGVDVAGRVEAVGAGVEHLRVGDDVFGWCNGAFAEFVCAGEDHFVLKPQDLTFEHAAAVPLAAMTALQGIRDSGRVEAGQKVLIVGASGGVGTFAVQIAKSLGAEVTGVCSTRNVELVRSIGADHVVDYTRADVTRGDERFDVIFELAGTDTPGAYRRLLTPTGILVLSSGDGGRWLGPLGRMLKAKISGPFVSQTMGFLSAVENHADLVILKAMLEAGTIRPVIDRTYPLHHAPDAIRHVDAGHTQGKTVITVA
jgi:NADPH:quinone reductase-like Zn-dependent oxidoreductase